MEIAKAEESSKAADHCYAQGLYNSSASRAYYAMFQAAQAALEAQQDLPVSNGAMPVCTRHLPTSLHDGESCTLPPSPAISRLL